MVVRILMLRRRRRLWGMNTPKRQPLQGRHSWGRHSDAERTRKGREPTSTHHYWDIRLECPDQGNDPANHCPPEEEVQKHNRSRVALAAGEGNNGGQKIHHEAQAKERKQKERGSPPDVQSNIIRWSCRVLRITSLLGSPPSFTAASRVSAPVRFPAQPESPSANGKTPHPTDTAATPPARKTPALRG